MLAKPKAQQIASKIVCLPATLLKWARRSERDLYLNTDMSGGDLQPVYKMKPGYTFKLPGVI